VRKGRKSTGAPRENRRLALHRSAEAAVEFQTIVDRPAVVVSDPVGAIARWQFARSLALSGNRVRAISAYRGFLELWKDADPNVALLHRARREFSALALQ